MYIRYQNVAVVADKAAMGVEKMIPEKLGRNGLCV